MKKVRELGYQSEKFMPLAGDDHDVIEAPASISNSDDQVAVLSSIYPEELEVWYHPSIHLCSAAMVTTRRSLPSYGTPIEIMKTSESTLFQTSQ